MPIEAAIEYFSLATHAENISDGSLYNGFDVVSMKQKSTNHQSNAEGSTTPKSPIF